MVKCPYCANEDDTHIVDEEWDDDDVLILTAHCAKCGDTFYAEYVEKRCTDENNNVLRGSE